MKFFVLLLLSTFYTYSYEIKEGYCIPNLDGTGCEKETHDYEHKYNKRENIEKRDDGDDGDIDEPMFFEDDEDENDDEHNDEINIKVTESKKIFSQKDERIDFNESFERKIPIIPESYELNEDQQIFYPKNNGEGLARRNGIKVGHKHVLNFGNGKKYDVITRSLKPLLFEIPNFLSDEECEHIIKRAKDPDEGGMFSSRAKGGLTPLDNFVPTRKKGWNSGSIGSFNEYDKNHDGTITTNEIISIVHRIKKIIMLESDVKEMFEKMKTDVMDDGVITREEFEHIDTIGLEEYLDILLRENPRFKDRYSRQTWLFMEQWVDPLLHKVRERFTTVTGLSRKIIYSGEPLQVVHYKPYGHYHAHHDSETHTMPHIPCCYQFEGYDQEMVGECKSCRYLTIMMYLNDVEEGGETAFPVAGDATFNEYRIRHFGNISADKYNLSHGCKRASLVIEPKKGTVVLWYNHHLNETTGWMGEMDLFGLHGGCDVKKGEKWLSIMWISAPYETGKNNDSIYFDQLNYDLAEQSENNDS